MIGIGRIILLAISGHHSTENDTVILKDCFMIIHSYSQHEWQR